MRGRWMDEPTEVTLLLDHPVDGHAEIGAPGLGTRDMLRAAEVVHGVALLAAGGEPETGRAGGQVGATHVDEAELVRGVAGAGAQAVGALVVGAEVAAGGGVLPVRALREAALVPRADAAGRVGAAPGALLGAVRKPRRAVVQVAARARAVDRVVVHPVRATRRLAQLVHRAVVVGVRRVVRLALHRHHAPDRVAAVLDAPVRPRFPHPLALPFLAAVVVAVRPVQVDRRHEPPQVLATLRHADV